MKQEVKGPNPDPQLVERYVIITDGRGTDYNYHRSQRQVVDLNTSGDLFILLPIGVLIICILTPSTPRRPFIVCIEFLTAL